MEDSIIPRCDRILLLSAERPDISYVGAFDTDEPADHPPLVNFDTAKIIQTEKEGQGIGPRYPC